MVSTAQIKRKWLARKSFTNAEHYKLDDIMSGMKGTPKQKANKLDKKWKQKDYDIKELRHRMNKHGLVGAKKIYAKEMGSKWANETFSKKIKEVKKEMKSNTEGGKNLRKHLSKKLLKRRKGTITKKVPNWY